MGRFTNWNRLAESKINNFNLLTFTHSSCDFIREAQMIGEKRPNFHKAVFGQNFDRSVRYFQQFALLNFFIAFHRKLIIVHFSVCE